MIFFVHKCTYIYTYTHNTSYTPHTHIHTHAQEKRGGKGEKKEEEENETEHRDTHTYNMKMLHNVQRLKGEREIINTEQISRIAIRHCTRELTYTTHGTESTARILHPPRHIILGNRVLSRPLHERCYFFAERLQKIYYINETELHASWGRLIGRASKSILPFSTF